MGYGRFPHIVHMPEETVRCSCHPGGQDPDQPSGDTCEKDQENSSPQAKAGIHMAGARRAGAIEEGPVSVDAIGAGRTFGHGIVSINLAWVHIDARLHRLSHLGNRR